MEILVILLLVAMYVGFKQFQSWQKHTEKKRMQRFMASNAPDPKPTKPLWKNIKDFFPNANIKGVKVGDWIIWGLIFILSIVVLWWMGSEYILPSLPTELRAQTGNLGQEFGNAVSEIPLAVLIAVGAIVILAIILWRRKKSTKGDKKDKDLVQKSQRQRMQIKKAEKAFQALGVVIFIAAFVMIALDKTWVANTLHELSQMVIHTENMEVLWYSSFLFLGFAVVVLALCNSIGMLGTYSYAFGAAALFLLIASVAPLTLNALGMAFVFAFSALILAVGVCSWGLAGVIASLLVLSPTAHLFF